MNRSTLFVLLTVGAVLAALNVFQFIDRQTLRDELASVKSSAGPDGTASGGKGGAIAQSSPNSGPGKGSAEGKSTRTPGSGLESEPPKNEGFSEIAKQWAKMMDNPAMKKQMLAQMEAQVGPAMEALYARLGLEGEELSHFKSLVAEKWIAQQQVGMKMMSAAGDPEKTAAIQEELKQARESTDEKVREFLNHDEDYAFYQTYETQLPDRMELEQYSTSLAAEGLELTSEQHEALLTAMGEERIASELGDISDPQGWDFQNFNEGMVTEVMGKMSNFHERVQVRAGTVLDTQQIEVLAASQEQNRSMQEAGMRMGLEMMRNMQTQE